MSCEKSEKWGSHVSNWIPLMVMVPDGFVLAAAALGEPVAVVEPTAGVFLLVLSSSPHATAIASTANTARMLKSIRILVLVIGL